MLQLKDGKGTTGMAPVWGGILAILCLASGPVMAQEMYLEASATQIDPGDSVTIFVWLNDVSPEELRAYQATLPESAAGGAIGTLMHDPQGTSTCGVYQPFVPGNPDECVDGFCVDGGNACVINPQCPGIPDILEFNPSPCIDLDNPDYVFVDGVSFPAADIGPPPRMGAALISTSDCLTVTEPKYLGEIVYIASGDANGEFVIDLQSIPDGTFLRDCQSPPGNVPIVVVAGVTIMVSDVVDNDVVDSVPPNNSIDARQPSNPDGSDPAGLDSIEMIFQNDAVGVSVGDFAISQEPPGAPPTIDSVSIDGNTVTVQLSGFVSTVAWTMLTYIPTGTTHCFGWLPADVNSSLVANPSDVLSLIDHLNGVISLPDISTDIDRSGIANASDVLRTIDLLNGGGVYEVFNGASLPPSPCD